MTITKFSTFNSNAATPSRFRRVSVASLDSPWTDLVAVLGALTASEDGSMLMVYCGSEYVTYSWGQFGTPGMANPPFIVDGSVGWWFAVGGKYFNSIPEGPSGAFGPDWIYLSPTGGDDTAYLQAAINAGSGKHLYFNRGTYLYSHLTVDVDSIVFGGAGAAITSLVCTATTGDGFTLGNGTTQRYNISFKDLCFTRQNTASSGYEIATNLAALVKIDSCVIWGNGKVWNGINIYRSLYPQIINTRIETVQNDAIHIKGSNLTTGAVSELMINNVTVEGAGGCGIFCEEYGLFFLYNSIIFSTATGIKIDPAAGTDPSGWASFCIISGCNIDTFTAYGIYLNRCNCFMITGNVVTGNAPNLHVASDAAGITVTGNRFMTSNIAHGIYLAGLQPLLVGNDIHGEYATPNGVSIAATASYGVIANNSFVGFYTANIVNAGSNMSIQEGISTSNPLMDGSASPGASFALSKCDHVHPVDISRSPLASPIFTGAFGGGIGVDVFPCADARGLTTRFINRLGASTHTDHFRSGTIPTGFAWAGSPFITGDILTYNARADFLETGITAAGSGRSFLYKTITNSEAAWNGKQIAARCRAGNTGWAGIRIDNGTDDYYFEFVLVGAGTQQTLEVSYKAGGAVTTTAINPVISITELLSFQMIVNKYASDFYVQPYIISEDGGSIYGTLYNITSWTWSPAPAGRFGLVSHYLANYDSGVWDWFYGNFG
jgi:hypothetical protein